MRRIGRKSSWRRGHMADKSRGSMSERCRSPTAWFRICHSRIFQATARVSITWTDPKALRVATRSRYTSPQCPRLQHTSPDSLCFGFTQRRRPSRSTLDGNIPSWANLPCMAVLHDEREAAVRSDVLILTIAFGTGFLSISYFSSFTPSIPKPLSSKISSNYNAIQI